MKFTNLFEAYNESENFRVLICAYDTDEAQEIADEYCKDTKLEGEFVIYDGYDSLDNTHFDCDYVLTREA